MMKTTAILASLAVAGTAQAGPFLTNSSVAAVDNLSYDAIDFNGSVSSAYGYFNAQFGGQSGDRGIFDQSLLAVDKVNIFIVNGTDGYGIFYVFDNGDDNMDNGVQLANEFNNGNTGDNEVRGLISYDPGADDGNPQTLSLQDDSADNSMLVTNGSNDPFGFDFDWTNNHTDGLIAGWQNVQDGDNVRIDLSYWRGINGFNLIGAGGASLAMGTFGEESNLGSGGGEFFEFTAVPMPTPAALASLGVGGLVLGTRRR